MNMMNPSVYTPPTDESLPMQVLLLLQLSIATLPWVDQWLVHKCVYYWPRVNSAGGMQSCMIADVLLGRISESKGAKNNS